MEGKEAVIKLKNGVKVFTRMADNARVTALAMADTMKRMREENHVIDEMIPMVDRIMASSAVNFVFTDSVFGEGEEAETPKIANRVLEVYIRWKEGARVTNDFIVSFSAELGSNNVVFAMGWDDGKEPATTWTGYVYQAMGEVVQKVLDDMDALVEEESDHIRTMSYVNIIQNEINKKIREHKEVHPEDLELRWPGEDGPCKTEIKEVSCEIKKISSDVVDIYPVREFCISCCDEEGNPLFRVVTRVKDPSSKVTDDNSESFVSYYDAGGEYTDFVRIHYDQPPLLLSSDELYNGGMALLKVILPAIRRVIPDLAILQSAIIEQTVNKIGKPKKKD